MAQVGFSQVSKCFGDVVALDGIDLDIADQEFLVLLGPSGCGKSTALRMIAGLDAPTSGTISIGGRVVNDVDPKDRDIAMVFQSYALYPNMSVRKNIEFPLVPRGIGRAERRTKVERTASMLGLDTLLDRRPAQLSGGQRQRVALARAIVREPQVFLMDEPLSNLDATMRVHTRAELVELHRRVGTTFVYVTHDQVEAMTMADRIAVMRHGRLQQVGPPQAVYDRPANLFVAGFIGSPPMSTLNGELLPGEGFVRVGGAVVEADAAIAARFSARSSMRVVVGVRAEHVRLVGRSPDAMPGRVALVESLGHERLITCEVAGGPLTVRVPVAGRAPAKGELVHVEIDARQVHLFDPDTTERIGAESSDG
jgi:multiple sugar transport system ATP-binding protein